MHRLSKQLPPISSTNPQLLTRGIHRLPLSLQLVFVRPASSRLVQVPRPVDRPVAEVAVAREPEWTRRFGVVEEVAD